MAFTPLAQLPGSSDQLRQALMLQMMQGQRAPQNVGEGWNAIGQNLAQAMLGKQLMGDAKAQDLRANQSLMDLAVGTPAQMGPPMPGQELAGPKPGMLPGLDEQTALALMTQPGGREAIMGMIQQTMQPQEPQVLKPGDLVRNPKSGEVEFQAPHKPEGPKSVAAGGALVDPETGQVLHSQPKAGPETVVSITQDIERQEAKRTADFKHDSLRDLSAARHEAGGAIQGLKMLDSLFEQGLETGPTEALISRWRENPALAPFADALAGARGSDAVQQVLFAAGESLSRQATLQESAAGILTDRKIKFADQITPTPEAPTAVNKARLGIQLSRLRFVEQGLAERSRYLRSSADPYGVDDHMMAWAEQNDPVTEDMVARVSGGSSPQGGGGFEGMTLEQLNALDPTSMSDDELAAAAKRHEELRQGR